MDTQKFGITEAIGYGMRTFIDHFMLVGGGVIISAAIYFFIKLAWLMLLSTFVFSDVSQTIADAFVWGKIDLAAFKQIPPLFYVVYGIGSLFLLIIYYGLMAGMTQLLFNIHDKHTGAISDLFSRFNLAPRMWVTGILYKIIVGCGLVLLIIPGIYLAIRFSLYSFFIVDKNAGISSSLRRSYHATAHHTLRLLGVFTILFLFNFIPVIGPVIAGFIVPIVCVYIYRKLTAHPPVAAHI